MSIPHSKRVTIKILSRLFLHDLADVRRAVITAKFLNKQLLFILPCHKVVPELLVLTLVGEC